MVSGTHNGDPKQMGKDQFDSEGDGSIEKWFV